MHDTLHVESAPMLIDVPNDVADRALQEARRTGRPVSEVVADWLRAVIGLPSTTDVLRARVLAAWDRPGPGGDLDEEAAELQAQALMAQVRSERSRA